MKEFLFSDKGEDFLLVEYVEKQRSSYDLAGQLGTYANLIRRALRHHEIPARDSSEAQRVAIASGRHPHPTKAKGHSRRTRKRIGKGVADSWRRMPEEERQRRASA